MRRMEAFELTVLLSIHSIVANSAGEYREGMGATFPALIFIARASWLFALKGRLRQQATRKKTKGKKTKPHKKSEN